MREPTVRQHRLLVEVAEACGAFANSGDEETDKLQELCNLGLLKRMVTLAGRKDWHFVMTEKGEEYLEAMADDRKAINIVFAHGTKAHGHRVDELVFVKAEDDQGKSVGVGKWLDRNGYRVLRIGFLLEK